MAEWFVGPIMGKVINTCSEYLEDQIRWQTGMKEELERLRENYPKIQAVVSAASQAQIIDHDPELNKWIWKLRDAIDEADDLLDMFEYMNHEEQLETNERSPRSLLIGAARKLRKVSRGVLKIDPSLGRLKEVVQKLDTVSAEVSTFLHLINSTKQEQKEKQLEFLKTRETGSLPTNDLIGRGKDMEFVIQWLRKPSNEEHQAHITATTLYNGISLLSIVGHGGMGKTTLLQHVYEDEITKEFDLKMWVCVSKNFDVKKVIADMLESLKMIKPSLESLDALQKSLKSEVKLKKFLLVLDDIWQEEEEQDKSKWEKVLAPLAYGGLGSKILITTRMNSAALMIAKVIKKKNEPFILKGLENDESLQLLNTHAFAEVENPNEHKILRSIARKLVKKLYGCPLAAKVMGGVLNSHLDEGHWIKVLNSNLGYNDIFSILKLSYIYLPKYLQSCFAFCCIFPQYHIFDKDDLVRMWIAVGFILPSVIQGDTMEDIGGRYFDILVKKSFFDKAVIKNYKMHDLLYELAQSVSTQECFRVMGDEDLVLGIPETIRHLSIETGNLELLKKMGKFKNLRTLCITYDRGNQDFVDMLAKFFEETRSIRLLYMRFYRQKMMLETIGCLKHLRYLNFHIDKDTLLPRSLSQLYHLQFMISGNVVSQCSSDDFFPRDMNNLSNLRYLSLPCLKFPGIGKLKFLEELIEFDVEDEIGYRIGELEHMNDLHILGIQCLENVRDAEEACNAKLCDKRKLKDLFLLWNVTRRNIADFDLDEKVLDNLQPHNYLKKLRMSNYMGVRSAIWMNKAHLINNLEHIELNGCLEWQNLPPFGQLPFLKSLSLRNLPKAKRLENKFHGNDMCCVFPSLEELCICKLEALEDWFDAGVDCLFPCLTKLWLEDCPNLKELPYLPPKLETLRIDNIGWKTLNCCSISESIPLKTLQIWRYPNITNISLGEHQEVENTENIPFSVERLQLNYRESLQCLPSSLLNISSLEYLTLAKITLLKSLPDLASSLRELKLYDLDNLDCLPSCLHCLSSLTQLYSYRLPQLRELADLPPSLCFLCLTNLANLNCLPSCLPSLSSLTYLHINAVPQLRELPDLPPSLRELRLHGLNNLDCLPSCLHCLSSLTQLYIYRLPRLREIPDLPPSLCFLSLANLDKLNCLPSCLPTLSSLAYLHIIAIRQLQELPNLPPSLRELRLRGLDNLDCLPSCLPSLSSLTQLYIYRLPQLRELLDLPPSLCYLYLNNLENLNCLPSCLSSHSSLIEIKIIKVPQLRELADLPPTLKGLNIRECHPELMKHYKDRIQRL